MIILDVHCAVKIFYFLPGCGGVIHADTGTIKSPNYPQNFPANVECSWKIIAHEGSHLEISINSDFQIPDSTGICQDSYVKVLALTYSRNMFRLQVTCKKGETDWSHQIVNRDNNVTVTASSLQPQLILFIRFTLPHLTVI